MYNVHKDELMAYHVETRDEIVVKRVVSTVRFVLQM